MDKLAEGEEQIIAEISRNQGKRMRGLRSTGGKRCKRLRVRGAVTEIENSHVSIGAASVTEGVITPRKGNARLAKAGDESIDHCRWR